MTAFAAHYRLLILGPILAAVTAYFVVSLAPRGYTSWAYLKLDKPTSRSFEAIATSPGVAGKVLEKYPDVAGSSI